MLKYFCCYALCLFIGIASASASLLLRGAGVVPNPDIIYVATTGSDSNSGSISSPFLTIGKAQTAAQARLTAGHCPTVYFRAGTYPVPSTLSFGSADSGSVTCTVSWNSYPSENAIWSGGTVLTGTFTLCTTADAVCNSGAGGVYQSTVTLTAFRELYVNGSHRTRAKSANSPGSWAITTGGYTSGTNMSSWGNPTNIEIVSASGNAASASAGGWQQTRCTIASISGTAVTMATPCWTLFKAYSVTDYQAWTTPWWVENAYELLPTCGAGCWYYNRTTHILYYIPQGGENMTTVPVVAPQLVDMVSGSGVSYVSFSRLTFSYTTWNPDTGGDDYISTQNGYYCTGTQNCSVQDNASTPMDGAITFSSGSNNLTFSH
jgi:hypothetical protein